MNSKDYQESLRSLKPTVYVDGRLIESVADEPSLRPGVQALGVTYDMVHDPALAPLMLADSNGTAVPRMLHINHSSGDLLNKLEAVRVLCQETGCAQRYLAHDALNAIAQVSARIDDARGSNEHQAKFAEYLSHVQTKDLALGIAMTDAKGDRSRRPHEQENPDTYVHIVSQDAKGVVISGTKAIVTGAPYMHEFLVMPGRNMTKEDASLSARDKAQSAGDLGLALLRTNNTESAKKLLLSAVKIDPSYTTPYVYLGFIEGGTFSGSGFSNGGWGVIVSGTFTGDNFGNESAGIICGGTFSGANFTNYINFLSGGTIYGGTFSGTVYNYGKIDYTSPFYGNGPPDMTLAAVVRESGDTIICGSGKAWNINQCSNSAPTVTLAAPTPQNGGSSVSIPIFARESGTMTNYSYSVYDQSNHLVATSNPVEDVGVSAGYYNTCVLQSNGNVY